MKERYYLEVQGRRRDTIERQRLLSILPRRSGVAGAPAAVSEVGWWLQDYQAWPPESAKFAAWPNPGAVTRHCQKLKG